MFLFNTLGYYFVFELYKFYVKKEIQTLTHKGSAELTILEVADTQHDPGFQRVEKKEIRYNGSLYDVIKEIQTGTTTIFYCIHDTKEENLLATMKTVNKNKFLLSLWDHVIKIAIPHFEMPAANPSTLILIFYQSSVSLHSALLSKWSPPPELS
jgi:hypothetical protein